QSGISRGRGLASGGCRMTGEPLSRSGTGRVLVTGASGFVGSAIAKCLLAAGFERSALVRASSRPANLADLDVEIIECDLRAQDSMLRAMADTRYLFHVAADYRLWARQPDEIVKTNVEGTRNIMEAALSAGVERVVYTSSVATLAFRSDGRPSDETLSLDEAKAIGAYKRSNAAAHRVVET